MESPKIGDLVQSFKSNLSKVGSLNSSESHPEGTSLKHGSLWSCPPTPLQNPLCSNVHEAGGWSPNSFDLRTPKGDGLQHWHSQSFLNLSPQKYHPGFYFCCCCFRFFWCFSFLVFFFFVTNPSSLIFDSSNQVLSKHLFKHFK